MKNTNKQTGTDIKQLFSRLETFIELYAVKKAPSLPAEAKDVVVRYSPYLAVIALIFSVPALLTLFGLGILINRYAYLGGVYYGSAFSLDLLFLLASVVLSTMAIPGLFARKASAWRLVYFSVLVNTLRAIFSFNLGGLIIGSAISLYILFQVKSYYK